MMTEVNVSTTNLTKLEIARLQYEGVEVEAIPMSYLRKLYDDELDELVSSYSYIYKVFDAFAADRYEGGSKRKLRNKWIEEKSKITISDKWTLALNSLTHFSEASIHYSKWMAAEEKESEIQNMWTLYHATKLVAFYAPIHLPLDHEAWAAYDYLTSPYTEMLLILKRDGHII